MLPCNITEAEVFAFLKAIEKGTVSLTPVGEPQDIYAGPVNYSASNGWTINIFNDCNEWDYIERLRTADGRDCDHDQICAHMPTVDDYSPSDEMAWLRYRIPGYRSFRCVRCGTRINIHEHMELPYMCPECQGGESPHDCG